MYVCNADAVIINRLLPFVFYTYVIILCAYVRAAQYTYTYARYTDIYLSFTVLIIVLSPRVSYTSKWYT